MAQTQETADLAALAAGVVDGDLLADGVLHDTSVGSGPDGYELLGLLGRGGAGEVYRARDRSLNRIVALKFLRHASPADIERFRREARFAARLECDAIVKVFALGEHNGQPYIVMQYLDGGSLRQAELTPQQVLEVARTIAGALEHAHRAGIIHRDIKPENILLDHDGRPYLSDFGIARDIGANENFTLSREGQIIGTPSLMSPEQARGDIYAIDARTDVYALGATMYYKLTRRYPFQASNVVDLLHAVMHEQPPLPRSFVPTIPAAVEALIMRCLEKHPADRFPTMQALCAALDAITAGPPSSAAATSPWFRTLISLRPEAQRRSATAMNDNAMTGTVDEAALEFYRELAEWDANLYRVTGSLSRAFQQLDELRDRLDAQLAERPDLAWARFGRGSVHYRRGRLDEALNDMEPVIDRVPGQAAARFALGRAYLVRYLRDHMTAHQHLSVVGTEYSLASLRPGIDQAIIALRESQRLRGDLSSWHREYADAAAHFADGRYGECVAVCDQILQREPDLEDVWKLRGDAQQLAGEEPFESYERAVEIRRSFFEALYAMARAYLDRDRIPEAQEALQRAIHIHPEFTEAMAQYARTLLQQAGGDVAMLRKARAMARRAVACGPDSFDAQVIAAEIDMHLGTAEADESHFDSAMQSLEQAMHLKGCGNRVQFLQAWVCLRRARLLLSRGVDPEPALAELKRFVDHEAVDVPDNEPWLEVFAEAGRIRTAAS